MSEHKLHLEQGQIGMLFGQNGSGKTYNGIFQMRHARGWPVIIFDTKIDDDFLRIPENEDETVDLVQSLDDFQNLGRHGTKDPDLLADYIVVRPHQAELVDKRHLDQYAQTAYDYFGRSFNYFDEGFHWHNHGQAGSGLTGLLTRGRSRGKITLIGAQRPAWLSMFCLTEARKFYIHDLSHRDDKKRISQVIPHFDKVPDKEKYYFHFYSQGETKEPVLYRPVPKPNLRPKAQIKSLMWI